MFEAGIDDDAIATMRRDNIAYLVGVEARLTVGVPWVDRRARLALAIVRALGADDAAVPTIAGRLDPLEEHGGDPVQLVDAVWATFRAMEF